jgi:hypothetical protein
VNDELLISGNLRLKNVINSSIVNSACINDLAVSINNSTSDAKYSVAIIKFVRTLKGRGTDVLLCGHFAFRRVDEFAYKSLISKSICYANAFP